jgi:hypothetical protein
LDALQVLTLALKGLQRIAGTRDGKQFSQEVGELLTLLAGKISPAATWRFEGKNLGSALYGLQSLALLEAGGSAELRAGLELLLSRLSDKALSCQPPMTLLDIACAFYGLQNMSGERSLVVHRLAGRLTTALNRATSTSRGKVRGQKLCMILHGMSNLGPSFLCSAPGSFLLYTLAKYLQEGSQQLSGLELSTALHSLHSIQRMEMLPSAADFYRRAGAQSLRKLYGFQGHGPAMARMPLLTPAMLSLLAGLLKQLKERAQPLSAPMVASALYGLQHCSAYYPVVRAIITELSNDLLSSVASIPAVDMSSQSSSSSRSAEALDGQNIANAVLGLKCMSSRYQAVQKLVLALATAIEHSPAALTAQGVGNAYYGLQNLQNTLPETRLLLRALNNKLRQMPRSGDLTGQHIGNALWGFKNMQANSSRGFEHREVLEALALLTERILQSDAELSGQNIANALYAMQHLRPVHREVCAVLAALGYKMLVSSQLLLTGKDLGMALYGLRFMDSDVLEVDMIFLALLRKAQMSNTRMEGPELVLAMMGLLRAKSWMHDRFLQVLVAQMPGMRLML